MAQLDHCDNKERTSYPCKYVLKIYVLAHRETEEGEQILYFYCYQMSAYISNWLAPNTIGNVNFEDYFHQSSLWIKESIKFLREISPHKTKVQ